MKNPVASKLLYILVVAVVSVALLGVLELSTRLYFKVSTGNWVETRTESFYREAKAIRKLIQSHPFTNTAPRNGARATVLGKDVSFNSHGYRSPERPIEKHEGVMRILTSGGSTTLDFLAKDNDASWPQRLERMVNKRGVQAEVWNSSLQAWSSMENVISFVIRDIDLDPDVVILFQGINDLRMATREPFDRQYIGYAREVRDVVGLNLQPLYWYERVVLIEKLRDLLVAPVNPMDKFGIEYKKDRRSSLNKEGLAVFEGNVKSYISLSHGKNAHVILVTQVIRVRKGFEQADLAYLGAMFPGLDPTAAAKELEVLNDVLRALGSGEGSSLVDAAKEIVWKDSDFADPMHFSDQGSEKFAAHLAKTVVEILGGETSPTAN